MQLSFRAGLHFADRRRLPLLAVLGLICWFGPCGRVAYSQVVFGSIVGSVVDQSGAAVPGAVVKITLTSTNDVRTAPTDTAGTYTIASVTPGAYTVEIVKDGFRSFIARSIQVNQNNVVRVDATLQVGATTERVEVTATAAELQTDRADIHGELASTHLMDLPQPNRTYLGNDGVDSGHNAARRATQRRDEQSLQGNDVFLQRHGHRGRDGSDRGRQRSESMEPIRAVVRAFH